MSDIQTETSSAKPSFAAVFAKMQADNPGTEAPAASGAPEPPAPPAPPAAPAAAEPPKAPDAPSEAKDDAPADKPEGLPPPTKTTSADDDDPTPIGERTPEQKRFHALKREQRKAREAQAALTSEREAFEAERKAFEADRQAASDRIDELIEAGDIEGAIRAGLGDHHSLSALNKAILQGGELKTSKHAKIETELEKIKRQLREAEEAKAATEAERAEAAEVAAYKEQLAGELSQFDGVYQDLAKVPEYVEQVYAYEKAAYEQGDEVTKEQAAHVVASRLHTAYSELSKIFGRGNPAAAEQPGATAGSTERRGETAGGAAGHGPPQTLPQDSAAQPVGQAKAVTMKEIAAKYWPKPS